MSDGQHGWHPAAPRPPQVPSDKDPARPAADQGDWPASLSTPARPIPQAAPPNTPNFDAVGMQSVLTRARDQSRFVAPDIEPERERRPFPVRALLFGFVGVLVIGVVAGMIYVNFLRPHEIDTDVLAKSTATASNQVAALTPQEIVTDYFTALAEGDIDTAMAMGPKGGQGSSILLTPEVYARTMEKSAIADLTVVTTDPEATEVQVTYTLGGRPVEATVALQQVDSGQFQLRRTTLPVRVSVPGGEDVPLFINGQQVEHDQIYEVVPGRYELTTGMPYIAYPATDAFTIDKVGRDQEPRQIDASPELTEQGRRAFIQAASESLNACMAAKTLAPANCPIGLTSDGAPVVESSIERTLEGDPFADARPRLSLQKLTQAESPLTFQYTYSWDFVGGSRQRPRQATETVWVRANVLGDAPLTVTWHR